MKVVSLDPGGSTGIVIASNTEIIKQLQLGPEHHHVELYNLLTAEAPDVVVCEGFEYRPHIDRADLSPVEYIGVVRLWVSQAVGTEPHLVIQMPKLKTFWDDDKLKKIGLYMKGMQHARDAMRHYLYYMTFTRQERTFIEGLR